MRTASAIYIAPTKALAADQLARIQSWAIPGVRAATATMMRWGLGSGIVLGVLVAGLHRVLPPLFTTDPGVQDTLAAALLVVAVWVIVAMARAYRALDVEAIGAAFANLLSLLEKIAVDERAFPGGAGHS